MPTYEYECEVCGETKEVFQKMDDPSPVCHERQMKKLIGSAPWIRKGAGLYSIDIEPTRKLKL